MLIINVLWKCRERTAKTERLGRPNTSFGRPKHIVWTALIPSNYSLLYEKLLPYGKPSVVFFTRSCQNATADAAATLSESTPWCMGMRTV